MDDDSVEKWQLADEEIRKNLPPGVELIRTLRGHTGDIMRISWSPDGRILASPSSDKTIRLWNAKTGECLRTLKGHKQEVFSVVFAPQGQMLASASRDGTVNLWESESGRLIRSFEKISEYMNSVAFDPEGCVLASWSKRGAVRFWDTASGRLIRSTEKHSRDSLVYDLVFDVTGQTLAGASADGKVKLWAANSGKLRQLLVGHGDKVTSIAFDTEGEILASASFDRTIGLWDLKSGQRFFSLEGHTDAVVCVAFSCDGQLLASTGYHTDRSIRFWRKDNGICVATVSELSSRNDAAGIAFHPCLPLLATVGSDPCTPEEYRDRVIHVYKLDLSVLLGQMAEPRAHYVNAKVVLVGDTGVGKTGLSLVLNNQSFEATDSTPGRRVWTFDSQEVKISSNITQVREALLWDLAGQPGYRVIHQLHLNEVAVALVVFDARSETDPLAGVRHWERALRLAQQRQGTSSVPMKKFLVSARNDRGGVSIGEDRLQVILREFGFDGYFKTSAKEGWQVKELRAAVEQAISWEDLPEVSSSQLFADIKLFLLGVKTKGRLLAQVSQLYDDFAYQNPETAVKAVNLRDQFDTCIGRLENRDLIRRLTFGGYILLQPELLDAYASAIVISAKEEPDGLGSIAEEIALAGKFFVPEEHKVRDPSQEQLLLYATVEELVRHDLALRENADDGRYLVFPSQFNRDYEDAPEPKGKAISITFDGPVQSLYSTLAVRLGHSGLFTTSRAEMWRNASVFTAKAGGKCGLLLQEFAEARGRLILFFDEKASAETRFHFEEFVLTHTKCHSLDETVKFVRFFVCPVCGDSVPDNYVKRLRDKGKKAFHCPCGGTVSLAEPKERIHFRSKIETMDKFADHQRDFDAFVVSAKGETNTKSFQEWTGGYQVTLAIVFTDIVGSTALGEEIRDEAMNNVRRAHFTQSRKLIVKFKGREIKTIGDSFMAAFKSVDSALDYAKELQRNTGHSKIQIRAGIHIGPMRVEENDVFGGTVNFAARVVGSIKDAEIWLSDRAKEDIDRLGAVKYKQLGWKRHDDVTMKGFSGVFTLWSVQ